MKLFPLYLTTIFLLISVQSLAETVNETIPMDKQGYVSIALINGSAEIYGWDKDEFHIEGELNDNAEGFSLEENNGNISFEEEYEEDSSRSCWFGKNCSNGRGRNNNSHYEIYIPRQSLLNFEGINVDVNVSQLEQDANIETINGAINISEINGHVQAETVNGSIEIKDSTGRLDASTVNGSIDVKDSTFDRAKFGTVNGRIDAAINAARISAESVNGTIDIKSISVEELEASTLNGRINLELNLNDNADIELSSFNGSIKLNIPDDTSARFEIETKGSIKNELSDEKAEQTSKYTNTKELRFVNGSGSSNVEISSFSGDILLEAR